MLSRLPTVTSPRARRGVGIGVIVLGVLLLALVIVRPDPFADERTISVRFDNAQGLGRIDRDVRVAGVNAGHIGRVRRDGDDAIVELHVDRDVVVHADASAALRPHTLFEGSDYVDLHPGSPSAPLLHGTLPQTQTRVYISLDQALRVLRTSNRQTLRGLVHSGSVILTEDTVAATRKLLAAAPQLVKELGPTARALQGPHGTELAGAIRGMAQTAHAVARSERALQPSLRAAADTVDALAVDQTRPLDASLAALPGVLQTLRDSSPQLTRVIDSATRAVHGARPAVRQLGPVLAGLRPLLRRSVTISRRTTPLVRSLRIVLARVAGVAPQLRRLVVKLTPAARQLGGSVLPFLFETSPLGAPNYEQLTAAFGAGAGALRQFQTRVQNVGGAGHGLRAGLYGDPEAFPKGIALPTCALVTPISAAVADALAKTGLCQT